MPLVSLFFLSLLFWSLRGERENFARIIVSSPHKSFASISRINLHAGGNVETFAMFNTSNREQVNVGLRSSASVATGSLPASVQSIEIQLSESRDAVTLAKAASVLSLPSIIGGSSAHVRFAQGSAACTSPSLARQYACRALKTLLGDILLRHSIDSVVDLCTFRLSSDGSLLKTRGSWSQAAPPNECFYSISLNPEAFQHMTLRKESKAIPLHVIDRSAEPYGSLWSHSSNDAALAEATWRVRWLRAQLLTGSSSPSSDEPSSVNGIARTDFVLEADGRRALALSLSGTNWRATKSTPRTVCPGSLDRTLPSCATLVHLPDTDKPPEEQLAEEEHDEDAVNPPLWSARAFCARRRIVSSISSPTTPTTTTSSASSKQSSISGFHRVLETSFKLHLDHNSVRASELEELDAKCDLALVDRLPKHVFVDPFESSKPGMQAETMVISPPVDVEAAANSLSARPQLIVSLLREVRAELKPCAHDIGAADEKRRQDKGSSSNSGDISGREPAPPRHGSGYSHSSATEHRLRFQVPMHARYQRAVVSTAESDIFDIGDTLPDEPLAMYIRCHGGALNSSAKHISEHHWPLPSWTSQLSSVLPGAEWHPLFIDDQLEDGTCREEPNSRDWLLPKGNRSQHHQLVEAVTFTTVYAAATLLVFLLALAPFSSSSESKGALPSNKKKQK